MDNTNAKSPNSLSLNRGGSITQRLGQDVVLHSTEIVKKLFENSEESEKILYVLLMLFKGMLEENCSKDKLEASIRRAVRLLDGVVEKEEAKAICNDLIKAAARRPNPLDCLF